jgi:hypothetical protein
MPINGFKHTEASVDAQRTPAGRQINAAVASCCDGTHCVMIMQVFYSGA